MAEGRVRIRDVMSENTFSTKADDAGKALKEKLGLAPKQVRVDGDGRQEQLPPEGSYARAAIEAERQKLAQQAPVAAQPAPVQEPAVAGSPDPLPAEPVDEEQASQRARERIEELARRRREEEQRRVAAEERAAQLQAELDKERAARGTVESEYQRFLHQSLEQLDPDDRARVLQDAQLKQLLDQHEQRIMEKLKPTLQEIREREFQKDLSDLARRYPGYDHGKHGEEVRGFMMRNPSTTPEQAFRAIATDEELFLRAAATTGVPSFVQPRSTQGGQPSTPAPKEDPNEALRQRTKEVHEMARNADPVAQRQHKRELDKLIRDRLGL